MAETGSLKAPSGAVCPEHAMLPVEGACERCGRFICGACDPLDGKRCTACRDVAARERASMPSKRRLTAAAVALTLSFGFTILGLVLERAQGYDPLYLVSLSAGAVLGGVAVVWAGMAWSGAREVAAPDGDAGLALPLAGAGCLLSVLAMVLIAVFGMAARWA